MVVFITVPWPLALTRTWRSAEQLALLDLTLPWEATSAIHTFDSRAMTWPGSAASVTVREVAFRHL